jgi:AbrB family looped-hinge helix DNA binding protein
MEIVKVTSRGQITIPQDIRQKMNLKKGDKIIFFEEDGKYYLQNSNSTPLKIIQKEMEGEAEMVGFNNPDDVTNYIKNIRKKSKK